MQGWKAMLKVDFKRELKNLYAAPAKDFTIADVPPMHYLMIDGLGDPNTSQSYKDAIEALYAASYTIKFASKNGLGRDYTVPPLEGLWWADDMTSFTRGEKSAWRWTMMIMRPDWITPPMIESAIATLQAKKALPALSLLRDERLDEGRSVQIMHIGSYADEAPVLARLHHEFMPKHGLTFNGKHHEIYLSDARKTAPGKLKTILRQPVKPVAASHG